MTDRYQYQTFNDLVADVGAEAMNSIRLNSQYYTVSTLSGARAAFSERTMVILRDVGYADILKLMAEDEKTASLRLPDFSVTKMVDAIFFTVASEVYRLHYYVLVDYCFKWAAGDFIRTLDRCAEAAEKIVSVRRSRDVKKMGESIRRMLSRFEHEGQIPEDLDDRTLIHSKTIIFRPVMNDQTMDWASLNALGIERPLLFELTERLKNYLDLSGIDGSKFRKLVSDEIAALWPKNPPLAAQEESYDR